MSDPYPEEAHRFDAPGRAAADPLDRFAAPANRQIGHWYCPRMSFTATRAPDLRFGDWIKAHWRRFPATDPSGGRIIDGEAIEIVGFWTGRKGNDRRY